MFAAFVCALLTRGRAQAQQSAQAQQPSQAEQPPEEEEQQQQQQQQPPVEWPPPAQLPPPEPPPPTEEQPPQEPRHLLSVWGGLGTTQPLDNGIEGSGFGGMGVVEYIFRPNKVFSLRPYSGLIITSSEHDCGTGVTPCEVSSKQFLMGAKVRLEAPIPYVAPFLDIGIGYSLGTAVTRVGDAVDASRSGFMYHVPFGFGLALGERHEFELSFQSFVEPQPRQFLGALAVGLTIPLR